MDSLYTGILSLLNDLMPTAVVAFDTLNEVLAYFLTIVLIWGIVLRPLLRAVKIIK